MIVDDVAVSSQPLRGRLSWLVDRIAPLTPPDAPSVQDPDEVRELLRRAGVALCDAGEATHRITTRLHRIATAYGAAGVRVFVLPTGVFIRIPDGHADFAHAHGQGLRLDQIADLERLLDDAEAGRRSATEAIAELTRIEKAAPRFGPATIVFGHAMLGVGLGLMLAPTARALIAYAGLSVLVGLLGLVVQHHRGLSAAYPVLASFVVTLIANRIAGPWLAETPTRIFIPPLVSLLPAAKLTTATIDLATGDAVAGSARLLDAVNRMLLLTFGAVAATQLLSPAVGPFTTAPHLVWGPWVGVAVFSAGVFLTLSAPIRTLPHLTVIAYLTFTAQFLGALWSSPVLGGFFGGLVAALAAGLSRRLPHAPPALVGFLPAFLLLVPGALGLQHAVELGTASSTTALADGTSTLMSIIAIAVGVLVAVVPAGLSRAGS